LTLSLFFKRITPFYGIDWKQGTRLSYISDGRGYALQKIQENNEAEIMQVVLSEARESYKEDIIMILPSDNVDQGEENIERIVQWLKAWVESQS
jgi:adenylate kinase